MSKKIYIFLVTLNYQLLGSQEYSNDFYLKKKIKQKQKKPKHKKQTKNSRYCEIAETCLRHKSNYVI